MKSALEKMAEKGGGEMTGAFQNQPDLGFLGRGSRTARNTTDDFQIERPDWVLFRSLATLGQKAGVPVSQLRRLAIKELVDNALDAWRRR